MSEQVYKKAVCRSCDNKWELARIYGHADLMANLNEGEKLAICPKCKHNGVSFIVLEGEDPKATKKPEPAKEAEEDLEKTDVLLEPYEPTEEV